jgi:MscS family membrane protein
VTAATPRLWEGAPWRITPWHARRPAASPAEFAKLPIETFARRDRFWYQTTLGLRRETTPEQIRYVLVEVRRLLETPPKIDSASPRLRFARFGSASLNLEVSGDVTVADADEDLEVTADLNLCLMDIVAAAGASFA